MKPDAIGIGVIDFLSYWVKFLSPTDELLCEGMINAKPTRVNEIDGLIFDRTSLPTEVISILQRRGGQYKATWERVWEEIPTLRLMPPRMSDGN
jgi:hypothetical protein